MAAGPSHSDDKAASLHQLWSSQKSEYLANPNEAAKLARQANRLGEHLLTIDIAEAVSETAGGSVPVSLLQAEALALARIGSPERASQILRDLGGEQANDAETLGISARIYKELGAPAPDSAKGKEWLRQAQHLYQLGLDRAGDAYCGINAAALSVLLDNFEEAARLASLTLRQKAQDDPYYDLATRAEAALIQKHDTEAATLYKEACALAGNNWADVASTRKQCRMLALKLYGVQNKFDECFPGGAIAIFSGHILDAPGRSTPRFPAEAEKDVERRISDWLQAKAIRTSFSSAAAGSDIIFLTAAQRAGIETHIILPFAPADFVETSVRPAGEEWVARFNALLEKRESLTIVNDQVAGDRSAAYDFTNRMIAAKAKLRETDIQLPVFGLAVWNGYSGDGAGGTADAVAAWCRANIETYAIHPTEPARDGVVCDTASVTAKPFERTTTALPRGYKTTVCAVLHIYFEDYFTMREQEYPQFQEQVLTPIAQLIATSQYAPESRYGLGADYAFVFRTMRAAGMFAGELRQRLDKTAGADSNLFQPPRMSVHAGPVFLMVNPVLNQYSHEGSTLTRAARMARRLTPGMPFCTEPFAALSALEAIREFRFEYAGSQRYPDGTSDRLFMIRYPDNQGT
jgi:Tetratricopeptide Repeats-Sensor